MADVVLALIGVIIGALIVLTTVSFILRNTDEDVK